MPKNRQRIPREERVLAIVDVAAKLFAEHDFGDVAMTEIARRAGIQSGAVYWYFESKDQLLAAVLHRLREIGAEQLAELDDGMSPQQRLIRHLTELRPWKPIHMSAHARLRSSQAVAEAHDLLIQQLRGLIEAALEESPAQERYLAAGLMIASFEGVDQPGYSGPSATELMAFVLDRITPEPRAATSDDRGCDMGAGLSPGHG